MTEKSFKVTLPGSLYEKNNRWWWKVKLPGETRVRARGLKAKGARFATADRDEAEKVADRVCIIDHGRILVMDSVDSLIQGHAGKVMVRAELEEPVPAYRSKRH